MEQDAEYDAEHYAKADLAAQESMAASTEALVALTDRQITYTAIEAGLLAVTIFFTAWAAVAASKAANAADRAVDVTREGIERELRAYVAWQRILWVTPETERGEEPEFFNIKVEWKNCGMTPARKCRVWTAAEILDGPLPSDFAYETFDIGGVLITESSSLGQERPAFSTITIEAEDARAVADGKKLLSVWGWFEYNDVFLSSPRRRTEFCVLVHVMPSLGNAEPTIYGPHNGADEDCHRKPET